MEVQKKTNRHVQWDEEKLRETEKLRGMFHKIEEPKTPYCKNSDSDEEVMSPQQKSQEEIALDASLERAKQNSRANCQKRLNLAELNARLSRELGKSNEMEDEDEEEQEKKRRSEEFKMKRVQHYNQLKNIQKAKQHKWEDEE